MILSKVGLEAETNMIIPQAKLWRLGQEELLKSKGVSNCGCSSEFSEKHGRALKPQAGNLLGSRDPVTLCLLFWENQEREIKLAECLVSSA